MIVQANNAYIFPAIGFAAVLTRAKYISDDVFLVAARCLSEMTQKAVRSLFLSSSRLIILKGSYNTSVDLRFWKAFMKSLGTAYRRRTEDCCFPDFSLFRTCQPS